MGYLEKLLRGTAGFDLDAAVVLAVALGVIMLLLLGMVVLFWRNSVERAREAGERQRHAEALHSELAELKGRLQSIAEVSVTRQSELSRALHERLDRVSHNLGQNLQETQRKTSDHLAKLNERLAVIDTAQRNITELSSRVVSLQDILANKQSRGAFGQMRMETIVRDGLPRGSYTFQTTLSNNRRPDCLVHLPGSKAGIVIDAKFPLEGFEALRQVHDRAGRKEAIKRIRADVGRHIEEIASRYFVPGETQDTALMFVPSEAIYAELHEHFPDIIQKAHRSRIVIVSPNMLMLAVQTMQAIMKDVQMREQADLIQKEVAMLIDDVNRLQERVFDLQRHYGLMGKDLDRLLTSSEKITSRGRKIETLDFGKERKDLAPIPPQKSKSSSNGVKTASE